MCQWKLLSGINGGEKYSAWIRKFVFLWPFVSKMISRWIIHITLILNAREYNFIAWQSHSRLVPAVLTSIHGRSLNLNHNPVQTFQECKDLHCCNFYLASFLPSHLVTNSQFTVLFYLERCVWRYLKLWAFLFLNKKPLMPAWKILYFFSILKGLVMVIFALSQELLTFTSPKIRVWKPK